MDIDHDYNTWRVTPSMRLVLDFDTRRANTFSMDRTQRKQEAGRRLRAARLAAGYQTREEAVGALSKKHSDKYSFSRVGNYELGYRSFGAEEAEDFAELYECSSAWLLCLKDATPMSPDEKALLENYRSLDPRGKTTVSRVAETQRPPFGIDKDNADTG